MYNKFNILINMEEIKNDKKIKVLLIDDDVNIRTTYAEIFKTEGFLVVEAGDGMEGFDKAIAEKPDVIFTGIIMPKMDGFALKDALAKNVATVNIPVLMSSHMGREEDRKKAMEMGVKEFFVAGMITPKKVVENIRALFSLKKYHLKFDVTALDAPKLAADFHLEGFACGKCNQPKNMVVEVLDVNNKEFKVRFVCLDCK